MAVEVTIQLNDESLKVPSGRTVKKALALGGYINTLMDKIIEQDARPCPLPFDFYPRIRDVHPF
jgi:hypothetical protein